MNIADSSPAPRILSVEEVRDKFLSVRGRLNEIISKVNDIKYGATPRTVEMDKNVPMGFEGIVELSRIIQSQLGSLESDLDPLQPSPMAATIRSH